MKLEMNLRLVKGYTTVKTETVSISMGDTGEVNQDEINLMVKSCSLLLENLEDKFDNAAKEYEEAEAASIARQKIVDEVQTTEKASYELRNDITELKKALARKECQMDGLIAGMNKEYIPTPDENNSQLLEVDDD